MFRTAPVTEPEPDEVISPGGKEPVPLSHLELDLPAPTLGWLIELDRRGIEIVLDDVGRKSISRENARTLLDEQREREVRQREAAARNEQRAIEADRLRLAQVWRGAPAVEGVPAAAAMLQADKDAQPRRTSVLQHALANSGELVFHPIRDEGDAS